MKEQEEKEPDAAAASSEDSDPEVMRLQEGIENTRAGMSATLASLETRLSSEEIRDKVSTELTHVEERVRTVVREQMGEAKALVEAELGEAKNLLRSEMNEAEEKIKRGLSEARDAVKEDVKQAITGAKHAVRAATLGQVENLATNIGDKMNEAKDTLLDTVRNNPIPAAITGVGLVWLLMNRSKSSKARGEGAANGSGGVLGQASQAASNTSTAVNALGHRISDATGKAVDQASDAAGSALHSVSDAASSALHGVSGAASGLAHGASDAAASAAKGAQQGVKRVEAGFQAQLQDNPVAVGAAVLAIGAVIGFSLPRTQREDELMGETRDRLLHQAGDAAHEAAASVTQTAEKALESVKDSAQSSGASA